MNPIIRFVMFFLSILIVSLYIPFALITYNTAWYDFNYGGKAEKLDFIGEEKAAYAASNLVGYFMHVNNLDDNVWNEKEKAHMEDVRGIYDVLFVLFLLSLAGIIKLWDRKQAFKATKWIIVGIAAFTILILPFFGYFWNNIFHEVFFSNDLWIINPDDISYYLFPLEFFIKSWIMIAFGSILINAWMYFGIKYPLYRK